MEAMADFSIKEKKKRVGSLILLMKRNSGICVNISFAQK
jgi:hypothetical protein